MLRQQVAFGVFLACCCHQSQEFITTPLLPTRRDSAEIDCRWMVLFTVMKILPNVLPNQLEQHDVIHEVAKRDLRQGNAQPEEIFADLFRLPY